MSANLDHPIAITADGAIPWHKQFNRVPVQPHVEDWAVCSGMGYEVKAIPCQGVLDGSTVDVDNRRVLVRTDRMDYLDVVSDRYQIVQPREILDHMWDISREFGFDLETAGVLDEGRKLWVQASTDNSIVLPGNDVIKPYLFMATSFDRSIATMARYSMTRVVCQNTLSAAASEHGQVVKCSHSTALDMNRIKAELGMIEETAQEFERNATELANADMSPEAAGDFFEQLLQEQAFKWDKDTKRSDRRLHNKEEAVDFSAKFKSIFGHHLSAPGHQDSLWGAVNAVTYHVDHDCSPSTAMFGAGETLKTTAYNQALALTA